jgi:uncharacterized hydrophobic protein (TIGR00271 family)
VHTGPDTAKERESCQSRIADTLDGLGADSAIERKIVRAPNVLDGIVQEAETYNLVLLGVSEESLLDRLVFGSIPLQVAARVPATALVQAARGISAIWTRRLLRVLRENIPALGGEQREQVRRELSRGARPGINFYVLIVLSSIIAALGLLLSSPAVVIGAMLVAPLMSPIMAISLGIVLGDLRLIRIAGETTLKGVALAVIIGAFIGLLSPLRAITPEMFARARPNLLDLAIALASGMAGAYALARKDVSAALPGVAIAAALVPPLATVGLALTLGNARIAGGALLLFLANIAAIGLAGGVVFLLLGIRPYTSGARSRQQLRRRLAISLLLVLLVAIPLGVILMGSVRTATQQRVVETALGEYLTARNAELVEFEIEQVEDELLVVAVVRSTETLEQQAIDELAQTLRAALRQRVGLDVVVLPIIRAGN